MPAPNFKLLESLLAKIPKAKQQFEPQAGQPRRIGVSRGQQKFEGDVLLGKNNVGDEAFAARLQQEVNKMPAGQQKLEAQRLVDSIFANREFSSAVRTNPEETFAETSGTGALTRGVPKKPILDPSYLRAKPNTNPTESNWEVVTRSPQGRDAAGQEGTYIFPEGSKRALDLGKQNFVTAREVLNLQKAAIEQLHNQGKGPSFVEFSRMAGFQQNRIQVTPEIPLVMEQLLKAHRGIPQDEKIFGTEQPQEVLDRMRMNRTGETETQPAVVANRDRDEIMADTKTTIKEPSSFDPKRKNTSNNVLEQVATTLPGFKFTAGQGNTGLLHVTWDGQPEIPLKEAISNPKYKIPTETKQQLATLSKSLAPLRGEPDGSGGYNPLPEPNMHEASASQAKALLEGKKQIEDPDNPSGLAIVSEEERKQIRDENKSPRDAEEIRNKIKKKKRYESTPPKLAPKELIAELKSEFDSLGDSSLRGEVQELMSRVGGVPSNAVNNLIYRIKQEKLGPDAPPRNLDKAQLKFTGGKRAAAEKTLLSSMDKISKGKVSNFGNEISKLLDSFEGLAATDVKKVENFMAGLTPEKQSIVAERLMKHPGGDAILTELSKKFNAERDAASVRQDVEEPTEKTLSTKKPSRSSKMSETRARFLSPTLKDILSQLPRVGISDKGRLQNDPPFKVKSDVPKGTNPLLQLTNRGAPLPILDRTFVFGSNPQGRHGAGAAKIAVNQFEAIYGQGEGLQGSSYALPTKDLRVTKDNGFKSIPTDQIIQSIKKLYATARDNPTKTFSIAYKNTDTKSLNGYTGLEMLDMFKNAGAIPENIQFSQEWMNTGQISSSNKGYVGNITPSKTTLRNRKKVKELEALPSSGIFQESGGELKGSKAQTPSESWFQRIRAKLNDFIRVQPRTSRTQQTEYSKEEFEKLVASLKDMDTRIGQWAARDRPPR